MNEETQEEFVGADEQRKISKNTAEQARKMTKSVKHNIDTFVSTLGTFLLTAFAGFANIAYESFASGQIGNGFANVGFAFGCFLTFGIVCIAKMKLPEGAWKQAVKNHESVINSADGASFAGYASYIAGTWFAFGGEYVAAAYATGVGVLLHLLKYKLGKGPVTQAIENTIVEQKP